MTSLNVNWQTSIYQAMIGTGGIGSGMFFALKGNHTLGREESRAGRFLDRRDYCKLHIISHYVRTLLGPPFHTILIGKVGEDAVGRNLLDEMKRTGLDTRYVQISPGDQTLFSVCFTYPDGSGGNLTAEDSACNKVTAEDIAQAEAEFIQYKSCGVALAAPEVPLEARLALLELATRYQFLRIGSFVSAEIAPAINLGMLENLDLVALNLDEAAMAAGENAEEKQPEEIVQAAIKRLSQDYPGLSVSLTAGKNGSWCWDGTHLVHQTAFPTTVVSTAGAGDAHLAGIIAGLVAGLNLPQAQQLGGLVAALSITSPHTIAPEVERNALWDFAARRRIQLDRTVEKLLQP